MTHAEALQRIRPLLKNGGQFDDRMHGDVLDARVGRVPLSLLDEFVAECLEMAGYPTMGRIREIAEKYEKAAKEGLAQEAEIKARRAFEKLCLLRRNVEHLFYSAGVKFEDRKRFLMTGFFVRSEDGQDEQIVSEKEAELFEAAFDRLIMPGGTTLSFVLDADHGVLYPALLAEIYKRLKAKHLTPQQSLPAPKQNQLALPGLKRIA